MNFHIITLFPESMESYIKSSIIKRAIEDKKISVKFYNPRDFTNDKHKRIDQKPYGGGPGMVIQAEPVIKAIAKAKGRKKKVKIYFTSPSGKKFTTDIAKKTANNYKDTIIICGRYEGIDARIKKVFSMEEISIGDYVLTGGEIPAMVILDSVTRLIPGVVGKKESIEYESFENNLLDFPHYTKPENFKGWKVPKILLSGDHAKVEEWRRRKALTNTKKKRKDLLPKN